MQKRSPAFTLIELLIVVAIVGLLAVLAMPMVATYRDAALMTSCSARLKQLAQANFAYAADHNNTLPPLFIPPAGDNMSWASALIDYVGGDERLAVGSSCVFKWNGAEGEAAWSAGARSLLSCPAAVAKHRNPPMITPSYARNVNLYAPGTFMWEAAPSLALATQPSKTIFLTDSSIGVGPSYCFASSSVDAGGIANTESAHPNKTINIAWLDGHITKSRQTEYSVSPYLQGMSQDVWSLVK